MAVADLTREQKIDRAVELRLEGEPVEHIARDLGVARETASRLLRARGCARCGEDRMLKPSADGLCGFCRDEAAIEAIARLAQRPPTSTRAVWFLLNQGYARESVLHARMAVKAGADPEEIAKSLRTHNQPEESHA